jgi:hypothetical protein
LKVFSYCYRHRHDDIAVLAMKSIFVAAATAAAFIDVVFASLLIPYLSYAHSKGPKIEILLVINGLLVIYRIKFIMLIES